MRMSTHKAAAESVDCAGACLAPGLIDMRVKTADPGAEHLEDLTTLLTAAAAAGITSLVALPDTEPVIDDASDRPAQPAGHPHQRRAPVSLWGGDAQDEGKAMAELGLMAEAGAVGSPWHDLHHGQHGDAAGHGLLQHARQTDPAALRRSRADRGQRDE